MSLLNDLLILDISTSIYRPYGCRCRRCCRHRRHSHHRQCDYPRYVSPFLLYSLLYNDR